MAITQVLQGCGAWNIQWKNRLPASVRGGIGDGAHLVVFESPVPDISDVLEDARPYALYEGVMTSLGSWGCSGFEMSWSLQQPGGPGPSSVFGGSSSFYQEYCEDVLDGINGLDFDTNGLAGFNGLFSGIYGPAAGPGYVAPEPLAVRSRADSLAASATEYRRRFGSGELVSWRMYPGFRMRSDYTTNLFTNYAVVISDIDTQGYGADGLLNVPAELDVRRDISNIVTEVIAYGDRNASTGVTPEETATNLAPFKTHDGGTFESRVLIDGGGVQSTLEEIAIRKANEGASPVVTVDAKLTRDPWLKEVSPGDLVYVWSADEPDLFASGNEINHFGAIRPKLFYVQQMTRNITPGMSVWLRNPTSGGVTKWTEVTEYATFSSSPASATLTDYFIAPYQASSTGSFRRLGDELKVAQRLSRSVN